MEPQHLILSGSGQGPRLLIMGGVHGDEFEPMVAVRRLRQRLQIEVWRGEVVLIPVANEPAFRAGTRCGPDGLDLARSFPGKCDGTTTERLAHVLAGFIRDADFFIDLHSGGTTFSVQPMAGYMMHSNEQLRKIQHRMARAMNLAGVWGTDSRLPGRSLSVARDARVPAIYAEYRGSATCDPEGVKAYMQGCLGVMIELGMREGALTTDGVQWEVTDARPGSGHMQIQNLAPTEGYFEAAVALGQSVCRGDLLGTISDPLGEEIVEVRVQQTGRVLVLRTFPRVSKGESLGVIVEM